jgi:antitoxin component HigA of HigAB toxin-antitoxin module
MSTATSRPEYGTLLAKALPSVIHNEKENDRYVAMLHELDQKSKLTPAEQSLAELLTLLVEDFEEKAYALKPASPAEVLTELMQLNNLKQKEHARCIWHNQRCL